jgi:hypothetical protein
MPNSQLCFFEELISREKYYSKPIQAMDTEEKQEKKVHHIGISSKGMDWRLEDFPSKPNPNPPTIPPSLCGANYFPKNTWKSFIHKGLGYEIMMKNFMWKNKDSNHTKQERQEFKSIFFGQLFYNRFIPNYLTPLEIVFNDCFPIEAQALRSVKKQLGNKLLAVQVQTLEGKFFHDICVNYLKSKYIDIPFTIKHDSITIPISCASFLIEELNELVKNFFNDSDMKFKYEQL